MASKIGARLGVVVPALDRERALRDLREHHLRLEHLGRVGMTAEPVERGDRHHDRIDSGGALETGLDVAAEARELEVGPERSELRAATDRSRRHERARGEPVERAADQRVARVGALGDRGEHEPRVGGRREILGRVHRDVGATVEDGLLDLFHEHAGAAEPVDLGVAVLVATRRDDHELRPPPEQRNDPFRLPPRERRPPSSDLHAAHQINDFPSRVWSDERQRGVTPIPSNPAHLERASTTPSSECDDEIGPVTRFLGGRRAPRGSRRRRRRHRFPPRP